MSNLISSIVNKKFVDADSIISEKVELIMARKLNEAKKAIAAKMCEQGLNKTAAELTRMGVVEEDSVDEMDVSRLPSDYKDIEDRRKEKGVNSSIKTNFGGDQEVASGKGDLPKKQTVNTSDKGNLKEEQLDEARIKIIKARIRAGKIQRRKKVSNVSGMTMRGGKLKRMSPAERRHRKMGQRRGKIKRRAKMNRALMKRQRSIRKRRALGL